MKLLSAVLYGAVASVVGVLGTGHLTSQKQSAFLVRKRYKVVVMGSDVLRLHTLNPVVVLDRIAEQEAYDAFSDIGCKARIIRIKSSSYLEKGEKILVWCELPEYSLEEYSEWHPWVALHVLDRFPYLKERVHLVRCDAVVPAQVAVRLQQPGQHRVEEGAVSVTPFRDTHLLDGDTIAGTFCDITWTAFLLKDAHWMVEVHELFHAWQSWMIPPGAPISDWHLTGAGRSFIEIGDWRLSKKGEWSNKTGVWLYGSHTPPPPFEEMASIATVHFVSPEAFSEVYAIPLRTVRTVYERYQPWVKEFLPRPPLFVPSLE
ncbi:MAG: hypothetical protein F4X82_01620 [Candidatus Spechtbacteria bacterium SB0662_bin_43]|uniref:Uncharacterized protein n=1 Tax=Candidatus Spechtbacteria bacterium SB0662_bin_43 TaxID=2604897 RepID=A0A845D8Z8_9BACT|nr:hypothetical protein [Candidatus Spechtbacteria bacterium SB0662_bin_43]